MSRGLSEAYKAEIAKSSLQSIYLLDIYFDDITFSMTDAYKKIDYDGRTYLAYGWMINFTNIVDRVTYEFENIPFDILDTIRKSKNVIPKPEINKLIQNRITEKEFLNSNKIKTTEYAVIKNKNDIIKNEKLLPGLLKTTTLGYDGKGQYKIHNINDIDNILLKNQ